MLRTILRIMHKTEYINLQPTELGILQSSAILLASKISNSTVTPANEDEVIAHCVLMAVKIARKVDETIHSEGEMG